jgi:hypothetical protein
VFDLETKKEERARQVKCVSDIVKKLPQESRERLMRRPDLIGLGEQPGSEPELTVYLGPAKTPMTLAEL